MSVRRVLGAAAALREFTVDQVAAFCDEEPPDIVAILESAGNRIQRRPNDQTADRQQPERWRVVDLAGLRKDVQTASQPASDTTDPLRGPATTRLLLAEETLAECADEPSAAARRVLVSTAQNHLRQVIAQELPQPASWWSLELFSDRVSEKLQEYPDQSTGTRLQLDIATAQLAARDATGQRVPVQDLLETVRQVAELAPVLDELRLFSQVERFVDLVTGQIEVGKTLTAPQRLITALTRRRVKARVDRGVADALRDLFPVLQILGGDENGQQLYQLLDQRPDGRDHVMVYADLLALLPRHFQLSKGSERLPGTLVEAVAEPAASTRLNSYADELASDLVHSPHDSESALIGTTAHVFQGFAERDCEQDDTVRSRCDDTRSELLTLARTASWSPATTPGNSPATDPVRGRT